MTDPLKRELPVRRGSDHRLARWRLVLKHGKPATPRHAPLSITNAELPHLPATTQNLDSSELYCRPFTFKIMVVKFSATFAQAASLVWRRTCPMNLVAARRRSNANPPGSEKRI